MKRFILAAMLALPGAAFAQEDVPEKVNQVIVYGDQECPKSVGDEIVICARMQDEFRIPENLRGNPDAPSNQAWGARAIGFEYGGPRGVGSCSPNGSNGATGCFNQLVAQARAERAANNATGGALIAATRNERLSTIDADSDEIEARVKAEEAAKAAAKTPE